ncbi:inositol monophosphatase family protein [Bacillaceae bacterium SIJ1]|uniref:inositol monophosphatase family protein n=1 Tax=Litoribacterium kuwaitense TaxID=1398745 RepID=UPI0013EC3BA5|nr:inositol monophosphatase family protein [Litoribacterium kuwaitense]NGP43805.1 inositol monophosphatase family protein [Litoribacterium kuwaitense]
MIIQHYKSRYDFALQLIELCKAILQKETVEQIEEKEHANDLVTNLDKLLNKRLIDAIAQAFDDQIIGEEQSQAGNNNHTWYIDPIDGTTNCIYRKREYAISIAYEGDEGRFGLVFDVENNTLYHAHSDLGAWINGVPFERPATPDFGIIHISPPYLKEKTYEDFANLFKGIRYLEVCSIEVIRVAIGEASCFYRREQKVWDYKAAVIFAEIVGVHVDIINDDTVLVGTPFQ